MRAKPERSLLNIGANENATLPKRAIDLIDPQLNVMYISSSEIDQKINRLKGNGLTYTDYPVRNIILTEGLSEFNLTLLHGNDIKILQYTYNLLR